MDANWCHTTTDRTRSSSTKVADADAGPTHHALPCFHERLWSEAFVKGDKKKQSLYFPTDMLDEMQREAERQERPLSWIMQQAWKLSRDKIMTYPGVEEL